MAVLKVIPHEPLRDYNGPNPNEETIIRRINYLLNPNKNTHHIYGGYNFCFSTTSDIIDQFIILSNLYRSQNFIPTRHIVLSLNPYNYEDSVTPEQLAKVIDRFCSTVFSDDYQVIYGIHEDEIHLHAHIVINTLNVHTGNLLPWDNAMMNKMFYYMEMFLKLLYHPNGNRPVDKLYMTYGHADLPH